MAATKTLCFYNGTLTQKLSRRGVVMNGPHTGIKIVGRELVVYNCHSRAAAVRTVRVHRLSLSAALHLGTVITRLFRTRVADGIIAVARTLFAGEIVHYGPFPVYKFRAKHVTVCVGDDGLLVVRNPRSRRATSWRRASALPATIRRSGRAAGSGAAADVTPVSVSKE